MICVPGGPAKTFNRRSSEKGYRLILEGYLENARILKEGLAKNGIKSYGGDHAPFLWSDFSPRLSWDIFNELLTKYQIVTTPGSGFGPAGEGYIRFSALGRRSDLLEALDRLKDFTHIF